MKTRRWVIRIAAIVVLIGIGAVMMVIGRGHTVYFDNKSVDYNGASYDDLHKVEVIVNGERAAKLYENERGSAVWIGQNLKMDLVVTADKGSEEAGYSIGLTLPYNMDGVIINIPAILNGLPQEAWLSEFIPAPDTEEEIEEINTDEFAIGDFGSEETE